MKWLAILLIICETLTILGHIEKVIRKDLYNARNNGSEVLIDAEEKSESETQHPVSDAYILGMRYINKTTDSDEKNSKDGFILLLIQVGC